MVEYIYFIFIYIYIYPTRCNVNTVYLSLETALHVWVVSPPIIRSTHKCIYSIWYLSNRYCYLPLSWKCSSTSTIAVGSSNGLTSNRCCKYICVCSWWWVELPPKHVEQFPDINKLCNVASCWIYIRIYLWCTDPWTLNIYFVKYGHKLYAFR